MRSILFFAILACLNCSVNAEEIVVEFNIQVDQNFLGLPVTNGEFGVIRIQNDFVVGQIFPNQGFDVGSFDLVFSGGHVETFDAGTFSYSDELPFGPGDSFLSLTSTDGSGGRRFTLGIGPSSLVFPDPLVPGFFIDTSSEGSFDISDPTAPAPGILLGTVSTIEVLSIPEPNSSTAVLFLMLFLLLKFREFGLYRRGSVLMN